uniref:Sorting nexin 12 n=1 Tax=Xiphophorus maculatus TaxID=8083 RepID=A0A3B5QPA5_XIPMA
MYPVQSPRCPLGGAGFLLSTEPNQRIFQIQEGQGGWPPQEESCFSDCLLCYQMRFKIELCADTRRLNSKPQDLTDAYGPPSNFLEIDVYDPQIVGVGRNRYTTYEVRMRTNLPIFKLKDSCVRRRYSDFEWLKNELERDSKIVVPPLPGKALKRQLPFRGDEGLFEEAFIEERRVGLEQFINRIAGHPLAQNERCLHMFLQEETIDRNYIPGKVRKNRYTCACSMYIYFYITLIQS